MSAIIKIGNNIPVDAFPPKMIARVGTTSIDTPGTPTFDIPISMADKTSKIHCMTVKSSAGMKFNFHQMYQKVSEWNAPKEIAPPKRGYTS